MTDGTASPDNPDTLYALADHERVNLSNGGVLLIHKRNDSQMIVAETVVAALQSCRTFRTLQQHVDHLTSTIPQLSGQQADVMNVMKQVRDSGLLTTADEACQRLCPPDTAPATDLPPTRVFIITCDRPAAVQRLLESMLHAGNMTHHEHLFLVDDSRDSQNATQNREAVARFNLTCPRDMHYVGTEAQKQLMDALIAELPEHEEGIRFLIDRERWADKKSYGLPRTVCLLLSVGNRAIVMDDDVICAAVESPHKQPGLVFSDTPREADFYQSQDDILRKTARAEFDPLTGHAQCLGLSVSQAVNKLGYQELEDTQLQGATTHCLDHWNADSPILITQCGTIGDPGTPSTNWILSLGPASVQRVLNSPGGLEAALENRHYWLGQTRPTFGKLAVISQVIGLDNSHLLPPYFPVFRGEDFLFGYMVEYLHPQAAILDYDWSVPHFPVDQRAGGTKPGGEGENQVVLSPGLYVTDHTLHQRGATAKTRLKSLAALALGLAEMSDDALITLYRKEVAQGQISRVNRLMGKLQDGSPRPEAWRARLQEQIGRLNQQLQSVPRLTDLANLPANSTEQDILQEFRGYASGFGAALHGWRAIREAAEKISDAIIDSGDMRA